MDIFKRLFGPRHTKAVNRSLFGFLLNNSAPDMKGPEFLAAYQGWVYACVNAIAEQVATVELRLERRTADGWQPVEDHIALQPLRDVNPFMTSDDLLLGTQSYLELSGEAFWYLPKGQYVKKPLEIWPLDPTRMTVVKNERTIVGGYVYRTEKGTDVPLRPDEVLHFKRFNPLNRYRGLGTVQAAALAIDTDTYSAQWNRNFFYNSAVPSAVLETERELTQQQYDRLKASWEAKYGGVDNAHKTAILEGGLTFKQAGLSQKDMDFLAGKQWTRDEICAMFRVPKALLGIAEDFNRANIFGIQTMFALYVITPRLGFLTSRLSEFYLPLFGLTPRDWRIGFKDPTPADPEADLKRRESGLKNGYYTPNEVREEEGKKPIPGGDKAYLASTMIPLDSDARGALPTLGGPGGDPKDEKKPQPKKTVQKDAKALPDRAQRLGKQITTGQKAVMAVYQKQATELAKRLRARKTAKAEESDTLIDEVELEKAILANWEEWIATFSPVIRTLDEAALTYGAEATIAQSGLDLTFDLRHPAAEQWLAERSLQSATQINETVKDEIRRRLSEGVKAGKGAKEIAGDIAEFFDNQSQWRALRVARTEVITAYSQGSLQAARLGNLQEKRWIAADDDRVDETCAMNELDGWIPLDKDFRSGHGSSPIHPNCRCSSEFRATA